jgi:glutamate-ammonia-ligase adenylyltransferase
MHLDSFIEYFQGPVASTLERLSLCKARPIAGNTELASRAMSQFSNIIRQSAFDESSRRDVLAYRNAMRQNASVDNIKRGEGGTLDVECFVQSLQICNAKQHPEILVPGTLEAIRLLGQFGILTNDDAKELHAGYLVLREIESGLRLMNTTARHDLPQSQDSLNTLAFLIGWESGENIHARVQEILTFNRTVLAKFFQT